MKRISRSFAPASRYVYDFGPCTADRGWAQIDTSQDASYYGQWINPATREILCYCEGDIILTVVDSDAELVQEIAAMKQWNRDQGHRFIGIDPGFSAQLEDALIRAGLAAYLHNPPEEC